MKIIGSVFLDLKLVNVQNTRSVVFMQGEIISKFYLEKKKKNDRFLKRSFKFKKKKKKSFFFLIKNSNLIFL